MTRRLAVCLVLMLVGGGAELADATRGASSKLAATGTLTPRLVMNLATSSVALSGDVASTSHAEVLARLASEHFPGKAIDASLEPAPVANVDWQVLTLSAVFVLAETSTARLVLAPDSLELDGIVEGSTELLETRIARVRSAAGPDFSSRISIHELDRSLTMERACRRMFKALGKDGIRFQFGTTELRPSAHAVLDRYVEFARDCADARLTIAGHTDSSGDEALNLYLSEQRALSVREYLVKAGLDPERVSASGKGSAMPVADNATAWGRSRNRRIELGLEL